MSKKIKNLNLPSISGVARWAMDYRAMIEKLWRYGWLIADTLADALALDERTVSLALVAYQGFNGLEMDGWAGPETERSLAGLRFCSHPDVMAMGEELNRWPSPVIHWWIDPSTVAGMSLDFAGVSQAFEWAWAQWAAVCGITPVKETNAGSAHVRVAFGPIDGPGRVLAWSELANDQQTPKQQRYDSQEHWLVAEAPPATKIDLARVACHEIGHVLGLPHIAAGNLLQPTYDVRIRTPQKGDITEAQARYGPPKSAPPPPPPPPVPGKFTVTLEGVGSVSSLSVTKIAS